MKRSEMVSKIHSYVFDNYTNLDVSYLLTFIEEAGMFPPAYYTEIKGEHPQGIFVVGEWKNEWEPEDETNK